MKFDGGSDTEFLFEQIKKAESENEVLDVFKTLVGPFSIICYFKNKLYFARDQLGRNSLIIGKHQDSIILSSALDPPRDDFEAIELPPLGVFRIDTTSREVDLFPYQNVTTHSHNLSQLDLLKHIVPVTLHHQLKPDWMALKSNDLLNFSFDDLCKDLQDENVFENLLKLPEIDETCRIFLKLLSNSVSERVKRTQKLCKNCMKSEEAACKHSHTGILFSGGVDCSMVAILADTFIDAEQPIDLMNVAFEKVCYNKKPDNINWIVPDRLTGLETLEELRRLRPQRTWNFVEINITRDELGDHLKKLSSLVFPLSNVLDESLGAALYFASRGVGAVHEAPYSSPCRVILIGSGADELFGGYTRHRNAFRRSTVERDLLKEELDLDWVRLPSRNLARDDRVIGDHSITVRAPFIEEKFVRFVQQLKPLQRCYPALKEGVGDKLLLRLCAYRLGLKNCSMFRKRALQFGSRIADKRQSAKDPSKLLVNGAIIN